MPLKKNTRSRLFKLYKHFFCVVWWILVASNGIPSLLVPTMAQWLECSPGKPGFNPRSSHTKDSKNGTCRDRCIDPDHSLNGSHLLSGATTPGKSGPGSDGNEEILCILQRSSINENSSLDCLWGVLVV